MVLVDVYRDILTKARADASGFQTINVWNNQTKYERDGDYPNFAKPALFVEVVKNPDIGALPGGVSSADVAVIFHVVHEFVNAGSDFEQNLAVFDLVNQVQKVFTLYKAPGCGPMVLFNETQDQEHTQIYEYMVGFVAHFIDTAGMPDKLDATMPAELQQTAIFVQPKNYIIPT